MKKEMFNTVNNGAKSYVFLREDESCNTKRNAFSCGDCTPYHFLTNNGFHMRLITTICSTFAHSKIVG